MSNTRLQSSLTMLFASVAMLTAAHPLAAQGTATQFIANVEANIATLEASITPLSQPLIFGGQDIYAYGSVSSHVTPQVEVDYVDGLKAAGVQRLEFNPAVTTINDAASVANLDVVVLRTRQLGMLLAINPEFLVGEFPVSTFSDFTAMAMQTYPKLAARYKPDNFVIVHEPTTQTARMGITATPADWDAFIRAVEPLIKAASPHTMVGAGDCSHCNEDSYFSDFVTIPTCNSTNITTGCIDFMTMDLYSDSAADFTEDENWAAEAKANGKPVYMEETFAPHDLGSVPTGGVQSNPQGAEAYSLIGTANVVFETLDQNWLVAMAEFDKALGMTAMTTFTTQTFFLYVNGPTPLDEATNPTYLQEVEAAVQQGQLTSTGTAYAAEVQQMGIKTVSNVSNASYATLPSVFNPSCGTANNPCNANNTISPDMLVSVFGADLAKTTVPSSNFPLSLGNTTVTLTDSNNNSFAVPIYSVAPTQVNYLVPSTDSNGDALAYGPASITVTSGDGTVTTGTVLVAPVAPGLYTATANGQGVASGIAVCAGTCSGWPNSFGQGQFWQYTFASGCATANCTTPISWGADDTLVIELYGTGIRHLAQASDITAMIGNTSCPVKFAGAQGTDTGLDQVNVLIPNTLQGAGQVTLTLTAKDTVNNISVTSNAVTLDLQ